MVSQSSIPFVDGWDFVQTLGEGAYGEVRLAVSATNDEAVAVKIIDLEKIDDSETLTLVRMTKSVNFLNRKNSNIGIRY